MQGANDPRVPSRNPSRWSQAFARTASRPGTCVFADEGHGFQKKPNNDLRREVETVFLRTLFSPQRAVKESG